MPQPLTKLESTGHADQHDQCDHSVADMEIEIHLGDYVCITGLPRPGTSVALRLAARSGLPGAAPCLRTGQSTRVSAASTLAMGHWDVGIVANSSNLIPHLSTYDNIALALAERTMDTVKVMDPINACLRRVGLDGRTQSVVENFSEILRCRVAIGWAPCGAPRLIVADDPTRNLEWRDAYVISRLLLELNWSGVTLCIATNDPVIVQHASRTIAFLDGRLIQVPPTQWLDELPGYPDCARGCHTHSNLSPAGC